MEAARTVAAGVDVGSECVKVVVVGPDGAILGRAVVPSRGYFQACVREAFLAALDEARVAEGDLAGLCATGFASACVPGATVTASETSCHALAAWGHFRKAMTVINLGGRDPWVIKVDGEGRSLEAHPVRQCAVGVGSFLMFAARHLDVHPTRLQELATAAKRAAAVTSFCSVFSGTELLVRLRDGATREEVALGCLESVAERILEVGRFEEPLVVTGGVAEYFPGVLRALEKRSGLPVVMAPQPIFAGALGAARKALPATGG